MALVLHSKDCRITPDRGMSYFLLILVYYVHIIFTVVIGSKFRRNKGELLSYMNNKQGCSL